MPALIESELTQLCESVAAFSQDAMCKAIGQARDPDKAAQLCQRLRREISHDEDRFCVLALCVVLGEAAAEPAIPLLLELATDQGLSFLQEAAQYALRRMGRLAFGPAMDLIESSDEPPVRVLAYEILYAAIDADPGIRSKVADFCLSRAQIETARHWPEDDWNPALAVCSASVYLGDQRIRPILEAQVRRLTPSDDRETYQSLLRDLSAGTVPDCETEWRTDWPEQCRQWAALYEEHPIDYFDQDDEQEERARQANARLAEQFSHSPFARDIPDRSPEGAAREIDHWLDFGRNYVSLDPDDLNLIDVDELLFEWMPRKLSADDEYFKQFPHILEAFLRFLHDTGHLADPEPFLALAREARTKLPELAADPANWGMAKSFVMSGIAAGYDMTTEQGMLAWQLELNARLAANPRSRPPSPPSVPDPVDIEVEEPIRRTAKRIGRNDPCPCGSGKKYKKCCGRA